MHPGDGRPAGVLLFGLPLLIVATGIALQCLPAGVAVVLSLWTMASIPAGIMVGHCALGEE
jgi:hypothetical protein